MPEARIMGGQVVKEKVNRISRSQSWTENFEISKLDRKFRDLKAGQKISFFLQERFPWQLSLATSWFGFFYQVC